MVELINCLKQDSKFWEIYVRSNRWSLSGSYEEKLNELKMYSLKDHRTRGDMIETYKIVHRIEDVDPAANHATRQAVSVTASRKDHQDWSFAPSFSLSVWSATHCHLNSRTQHQQMRSRTITIGCSLTYHNLHCPHITFYIQFLYPSDYPNYIILYIIYIEPQFCKTLSTTILRWKLVVLIKNKEVRGVCATKWHKPE